MGGWPLVAGAEVLVDISMMAVVEKDGRQSEVDKAGVGVNVGSGMTSGQ